MRISGTEPSSVILSQTKQFKKKKSDPPKVPNHAQAKGDGVINPQNYNFINFNSENSDGLKTLRINRNRSKNLATCALGDSLVHQQWHSPSSWKKRKRSDSALWQKPLHRQKNPKSNVTTQRTPPKTSITQRLRTHLGRSAGVTIATQLVWLNRFTGSQPSH